MPVFHSELLRKRFANTHATIGKSLAENGIAYIEIPQTKDIWCRDYMPVMAADGRLVQFVYWPRYLQAKKYKNIITPPTCYAGFDFGRRVEESVVILDGGNIQLCGRSGIVTERVFEDNYWYDRTALIAKLRETLNLERLIVIPVEPGDETGHSDGVVRFIDESAVLLNDYSSLDYLKNYDLKIRAILKEYHLEIIPFPYVPTDNQTSEGMPSAEGVYINFLRTERTVLLPVFNEKLDDIAFKTLNHVLANHLVVPIDCRELARQGGGIINCVSWETPDVGSNMRHRGEGGTMADYTKIPGVGARTARLIEATEIKTFKDLSTRNATNLRETLVKLNNEKKLVSGNPSVQEVQRWIDEAKKLREG